LCAEAGQNPFATCRPLDEEDAGYRTSYAEFDIDAERAGRFSRKDLLIHHYEDTFLRPLARPEAEAMHDEWVGASGNRIDVLVLRDPFNLFASRRKSGYGGVSGTTAMKMWKQHAREFLGLRNLLTNRRVLVNYNRWAGDPAYRCETARALGMQFTDAGFETVPAVASGSSFDGLAFDGAASRMPVTQRWRHYARDPEYLELFDAEVVKLSERVFGEVCKVEVVLRSAGAQASTARPAMISSATAATATA
jgi:hypothetical protein